MLKSFASKETSSTLDQKFIDSLSSSSKLKFNEIHLRLNILSQMAKII